MKKDSLQIKAVDNVLVVSTLDMWEPLEVDHNTILKMVKKYESKFQDIRTFGFEIQKSGGRPTSFCHLDEEQATFLITLMRNSDPVVNFKHRMSREFYRMKTEILRLQSILANNRSDPKWLESRAEGKEVRLSFTDTVNRYKDYAKSQGSTHFGMLFMSLSKMINSSLFDVSVKCKNLRDLLDVPQLKHAATAEFLTEIAIEAGMESGLHYKKEINPMCKAKVEAFAAKVGRTPVPKTPQLPGPEQRSLIGTEVTE